MIRRRLMLMTLPVACVLAAAAIASAQAPRVFPTPEAAVEALRTAARAKDIEPLVTLLGAEGRELAAGSDPATARQHRDVFLVAMREGWKLEGSPVKKELVVGREEWPFPVPIVKRAQGWSFDAAAGKEEVLTRRIGRNELAVLQIASTYVSAQRAYARQGHDDVPAGAYARRFASTPGRQDGLYWAVAPGQPHSPLGPLVAEAAASGQALGKGDRKTPFHGYYFRILERQGASARGGARNYVAANGVMTGGFALVAWPAEYGATGVMTFLVGPDGTVFERDLGEKTTERAAAIGAFDPASPWRRVEEPAQP